MTIKMNHGAGEIVFHSAGGDGTDGDPYVPVVSVGTVTAGSSIYNGKKLVTTAGTRVALAASQAVSGVLIRALSANTGKIYVGNASVSSANGYELSAEDQMYISIDNLATVYIDSSVNGEGVTYIAT